MSEPAYRAIKARRLLKRNFGVAMIILGMILCVAMRFRAGGRAFMFELGGGLTLIVVGWILVVTAYRRPTREILMLARDRKAPLTPADLVTEMDLELADAKSILEKMSREGLLQRADNAESYVPMGLGPAPIDKP